VRRLRQVASVMLAAGLAAVAGWSSTKGSEAQAPEPSAAPKPEPVQFRPELNGTPDATHRAIAAEVPGFGGFSFSRSDPTRLNVYLKDPVAERGPITASLEAHFGDHPSFDPTKIDVIQGQYSYRELQAWHDLVTTNSF
jgi:hypothetical protein